MNGTGTAGAAVASSPRLATASTTALETEGFNAAFPGLVAPKAPLLGVCRLLCVLLVLASLLSIALDPLLFAERRVVKRPSLPGMEEAAARLDRLFAGLRWARKRSSHRDKKGGGR
jgi:hypothetical protein